MTDAALTIRLATAEDIPAAAAVHIESCLDAYRGFAPDEVLRNELPRNLRRIWADERLERGDFLLIAEEAGAVVGLVTVRKRETAYVDHFHVSPSRKGGGVGRALMRALVAELLSRGETTVYLDVAKGNDAALAFYVAMGGEPGEEIEGDLFGFPLAAQVVRWPDLRSLKI